MPLAPDTPSDAVEYFRSLGKRRGMTRLRELMTMVAVTLLGGPHCPERIATAVADGIQTLRTGDVQIYRVPMSYVNHGHVTSCRGTRCCSLKQI